MTVDEKLFSILNSLDQAHWSKKLREILQKTQKSKKHGHITAWKNAINGLPIKEPSATILGVTFKEDCPDMRNSKVLDIIDNLKAAKINIQISDPIVSPEEVVESTGIELTKIENLKPSNILVLAVAHNQFKELDRYTIKKLLKDGGSIYDLKNVFKKDYFIKEEIKHWKL